MLHRKALVIMSILLTIGNAPYAYAEPSSIHTVKYIVHSDVATAAEIYYRGTDPTDFADYSHDPYRYSLKVEAFIAPGAPWELETALADPGLWAMVVANDGLSRATPGFRCELVVDGVTQETNAGPKGALCSLRHW
jgi:hypothetical protein